MEQRGPGHTVSDDTYDELQQVVPAAKPKKTSNGSIRAGAHGSQVACALKEGLFDLDSGLGSGGPSAWD